MTLHGLRDYAYRYARHAGLSSEDGRTVAHTIGVRYRASMSVPKAGSPVVKLTDEVMAQAIDGEVERIKSRTPTIRKRR